MIFVKLPYHLSVQWYVNMKNSGQLKRMNQAVIVMKKKSCKNFLILRMV